MINTRPISDSKALNIFKKIGNFLETDLARQQVLEIILEMRLKEVFERYQYIIESNWSDPCGIFSEENYKSILDFYKENIPKYTGENFSPSNISEFTDKANLFVNVGKNSNVRSIDNYLRKFENLDLCFDLNEDKLIVCKYDRILFTRKTYHKIDSFVKMDVLSLFNFASISSIKNIHKFYSWIGVEHLIRYVSGIITVEEFVSGIIAAMKKNLSHLIELWLNQKEDAGEAMMFVFPPDFYNKDEIIDCFIKKSDNFNDLINSGVLENLLDPKNKNNSYLKSVLEEGISINYLSKEQFFNLVIMLNNKFKIEGYSELSKKEKLSAAFDYFDDYDQLKLENKKINPVSLKILQEFYTEDEIFELAKENVRQVIKTIGESDEDYTNDNLVLCLRDGNRKKRVQFLYSPTDENRTLKISEEQLAELKAEFIPMLEKIQNKICYKFNNIDGSFDPLIDTAEGFHNAIIKNNPASTFGDLFKLLNWYPESINVLVCADMMKEFSNKIESCSLLSNLINVYEIDTKITLLLPEKFSDFYKENKDKISILLNQMFGQNAEVLLSGFEEHIEKIKSVCSRTSNSSRDLLFKFEVVE